MLCKRPNTRVATLRIRTKLPVQMLYKVLISVFGAYKSVVVTVGDG